MADMIPPAILPVATRAYCRRKKQLWSVKPGGRTDRVLAVETLPPGALNTEEILEIFKAGKAEEYFAQTFANIPDADEDQDDPFADDDDVSPASSHATRPRPDIFVAFDCECVAPLTRTMPGFETDPRWDWRTQNLIFGVARIGCFEPHGVMRVFSEIVFYPDELPSYGLDILRQYFDSRTHSHTAAVGPQPDGYVVGLPEREADPTIVERRWKDEPGVTAWLMPLSGFLKEFYRIAYQQRALVIGFNLPFDLSRLTYRWGISKERRTLGGWSLGLWSHVDEKTGLIKPNMFRPWIRIKKAGPYFSFISFTNCKDGLLEHPEDPVSKRPYQGQFLDLGTLAFALTSKRSSLASAVKTFCNKELDKDVEHGIISPEYIDYGRNDVKATVKLASALLKIFDNHPVSRAKRGRLSETKAYSPASFAKAYLRAAGFAAPNVPEDRIGPCFAAFYGGWSEVGIRGRIPVVLLDFKKMYQTQFILQDIQRLLSADRLLFVDDTEVMRRFVDEVTLDDLFKPETWPLLTALCWIIPDGDILMTKARFDEEIFSSGMVPRYRDEKVPYYLADIVLSKLLTGKVPKIVKAERIVGIGRQKLSKITLPGGVEFDPDTQNFFKLNVEEGEKIKDVDDALGLGEKNRYRGMDTEARLALVPGIKALGNSGAYGIFAETNEQDLPSGNTEKVELLYDRERPLEAYLIHPEDPGPFCCPPLAGLIPAGARLLLGMAHRLVMDRGGTVAFGDTDSLAVVGTETGEYRDVETVGRGPVPVKTLSWSQVVEVVNAFIPLNPYDQSLVKGSILEIKEVNYAGDKKSPGFEAQSTRDMIELAALCISSKRYCLTRPDGTLADKKESMLGMLLSPLDASPGDDRREASRDWIGEAWLAIDDLWERRPVDRQWMERPTVRRLAATSPAVMKNLTALT